MATNRAGDTVRTINRQAGAIMIRPVAVPSAFGERLRRERLRRKLSQREAAARFGVSQPSYYRWESGQIEPATRYRRDIADWLGITLDELFELIGTTGAPMTHAELEERVRDLERDSAEYRELISELQQRVDTLEQHAGTACNGGGEPPNAPSGAGGRRKKR